MKRLILTGFILLLCLAAAAQSAEKADRLFTGKQYAEAGEQYRALLRRNPQNALYNYRYARCCYETGDRTTAITHFVAAGERYPLRNFYLGELYFEAYEFEKSVEAYGKYLPTLKTDDPRIPDLQRKTEQAAQAARFMTRVEDIAIVDSLVVSKDDFLDYYRFSSDLGVLQQTRLRSDSVRREDRIDYTTQRQDRRYFSDSVGGKMKLLTAYRLLDGWSRPALLPETVNADGNTNYPFLMADGVTLYFASDGEASIGGYDIFITKYVPATDRYLTPENVGMPFNSPYNDYMMVVDEANGLGWWATDRNQPEGKVALYLFVPNEAKQILRTDDPDYIRRAARLDTFRLADLSAASPRRTVPRAGHADRTATEEIAFIVTDEVVYTRADQFRSPAARQAWTELQQLNRQLNNMNEQLATLRREYAQTTDEARLSILTPKILALEEQIRAQDELIRRKTVAVRNEEIKQLNASLPPSATP